MTIARTERVVLRELVHTDAAFILELVNDPAWLRFILSRVLAITDLENLASRGLLASLGFVLEHTFTDEKSGEALTRYARDLG